jgi:hypothetical protein
MIGSNCNVGKKEKNIRALIGILIFSLGILYTNWLGFIAIYPLLTSVFKWCPVNYLFNIDNCNVKDSGNPFE